MKKLRINLKNSTKSWSFLLYETITDCMYAQSYPQMDKFKKEKIELIKRGQFLEIEWCGSEYFEFNSDILFDKHSDVLKKSNSIKFNYVKIGKSIRTKSGIEYITGHEGWVPGNVIPWSIVDSPDHIKVIELKGRLKPRIDFSQLFQKKQDITSELLMTAAEDAGIC